MPNDKTDWPSPPPATNDTAPKDDPSKLPAAPKAPVLVVAAPAAPCTSAAAGGFSTDQRSIEPGDQVCEPVLRERARRKGEDTDIRGVLQLIQTSVDTNHKLTRKAAMALFAMVLMAALEYMGVIGGGKAPIWAKAVIDALVPAATTAESK